MNLHMPQDVDADSELRNLAAVPYQIVSPANNKPIIGIFQDSMLGCNRFTREGIKFTPRQAMNILMMFQRVNEELFTSDKKTITNFELLSQILPPLSLHYKTKLFGDGEDSKKSNNVLEIKNGEYLRGQMDKDVLGSGSKGLIHRICNDYGNFASANFIDDLQNIITEYMKSSAYSVGISDLISDDKTKESIIKVINEKKTDVKNLIDQTQIGVLENNTGKTNQEEFETKVNNILNQASSEAGKIGLKSLDKDNRFVIMVNAGSKGSDLNISQMISCIGQQNVDGKRIPYGFDRRTLPHFTKFDDTPGARGFVESSYINGLNPQEMFFHAMAGRIGLIDTAVKTSSTGYIQRRLIKGLEDLMVNYDMTVRTNKGKVVEFSYGDDGIDPVKVENQGLKLVEMSIQDIYGHFNIPDETGKMKTLSTFFEKSAMSRFKKQNKDTQEKCKFYTDMMIQARDEIIKNVFKYKGDSSVSSPVGFAHIISNIQGQQTLTSNSIVDITPLEAFEMIESAYANLEMIRCAVPSHLFKILYYFHLSPKELLIVKRFNRAALTILLETIAVNYKRAIVAPGEMVGMIAAQSIGEPTTQMTLNTFHHTGISSKSNVTRGVPRIEEILSLSSEPKNPSLTIFLKPEDQADREKAQSIMYMLEHTKMQEIVKSTEISFDPDDLNSLISEDHSTMEQYRAFESMMDECNEVSLSDDTNEKSKWILRMEMDPEIMLEKNITMDDVNFTLKNSFGDEISCVYTDYNADKLVFRIRMNSIMKQSANKSGPKKAKVNPLDQSDQIYLLKNFQDQLLNNIVIRGIKKINKVILRKIKDNVIETAGSYKKEDIWVLDTVGSNLIDVLAIDYIDAKRTFSNDIVETYNVFGIEAARQTIMNELAEVIEFDGTYVNYHHMCILCDRMTFTNKMISIFRHGINNDNIGPIAKASFEETPEMFLKAARHAELDMMRGVSANIMCGQEGLYGTNAFQVVLDLEEMRKLTDMIAEETVDLALQIEKSFGDYENVEDKCSTQNLTIENNVNTIKTSDLGTDNDYEPGF